MPAPRTRPGDATGRAKALLTDQHKDELALKAQQMSMITAVEEAERAEIVDLTSPIVVETPQDEYEQIVLNKEPPTIDIRVVENINEMTFGAGHYYSFEVGRTYKVVAALAEHLAERGYLWGR